MTMHICSNAAPCVESKLGGTVWVSSLYGSNERLTPIALSNTPTCYTASLSLSGDKTFFESNTSLAKCIVTLPTFCGIICSQPRWGQPTIPLGA